MCEPQERGALLICRYIFGTHYYSWPHCSDDVIHGSLFTIINNPIHVKEEEEEEQEVCADPKDQTTINKINLRAIHVHSLFAMHLDLDCMHNNYIVINIIINSTLECLMFAQMPETRAANPINYHD